MIIIFAIFLTTVFANSHAKYMDLLPDGEKQEFLDKVPRRITESVESNVTYKESRELNDDQLNERNSYLQSVMEQETAMYDTQRNKRDDRSSEGNTKSKENDDSEEGVRVKPLQFRNVVVVRDRANLDTPEEDNIDLAVLGMNRRNYDKILQDNITDRFKTANVMEDTLSLQTRSITSDVNSEETTKASIIRGSNEEKSNLNVKKTSTLNSKVQVREPNLVQSTTESNSIAFGNNSQFETSSVISSLQKVDNISTETAMSSRIQILEYVSATDSNTIYPITEENDYLVNDFLPSSKGSDNTQTSSLTDESNTDSVINMTTNESAIQVIQRPEFKSEVHVHENYSTVNDSESSSKATGAYLQNSSDIVLTDESTIYAVIDTTANESTDVSTTVRSQEFITMTQNPVKINTVTTGNYSTVREDTSAKELLETITETTTFTPVLTTINIKEEQSTKEQKDIKLSNTIKQSEDDTLVSYIASRALKNLKHKLELKKQGKLIDNEIGTTNIGITHLNHYRVYEISWATKRNNQPFLRSQQPIKNQPHVVPVHKYEPNEIEEHSIELKTHELREGNKKIHDEEHSEFKLQSNNELRKFVHLRKGQIRITRITTTAPSSEQSNSETIESYEAFNGENIERNKDEKKGINNEKEENKNKKEGINNKKEGKINKKEEKINKNEGKTKAERSGATDEDNDLILARASRLLRIPLKRSNVESKESIYMNVLKDLILDDNKALKQYDWLTTTVQIQTSLAKILKLIKCMKQSEPMHPADLQILRYMAFLYNFSLEIKGDNIVSNKLGKRLKLLRNKKKKYNKFLKEKGLINIVWLYLRTLLPDLVEENELNQLYEFLIDVQDGLLDLHEAIRHIAEVTKFNRQNWYVNLKQLYLSADEKQLLELLLHNSMSRLVDLVEHSNKHSLDHDFIQFVKTNKEDAKMIVEEMIIINNIVHEIKINKE